MTDWYSQQYHSPEPVRSDAGGWDASDWQTSGSDNRATPGDWFDPSQSAQADNAVAGDWSSNFDFDAYETGSSSLANSTRPAQNSANHYNTPPPPAPSYDLYQSQQAKSQQPQYNSYSPDSSSKPSAEAVQGQEEDYENEPPLLEELGINFDHIRQKTLTVLNPLRGTDASVINDNDLAGPLVFCLLFGCALLLHGKVQFGYIYGIGALGCAGMTALLNLMSLDGITLTCCMSVLGYCLLPMAVLSLLAAGLSLSGPIGFGISIAAVLWCSISASKLFVIALQLDHQRLLVAYPCCLLYGVFGLLAVF